MTLSAWREGFTRVVHAPALIAGVFGFFGDGPPEMLCVVTLILGIATLRRESRRGPAAIVEDI